MDEDMTLVNKAREEAERDPEVVAAAEKVTEAAKALSAEPESEERKKALDEAVHAHATAMSTALIGQLLKGLKDGGRRRKTRKGGKKTRATRKSRR